MEQPPEKKLNVNYRIYTKLRALGYPVEVDDFIVGRNIYDDKKWDEVVKIYFREIHIPKN